jgi:hypothetical protein
MGMEYMSQVWSAVEKAMDEAECEPLTVIIPRPRTRDDAIELDAWLMNYKTE